MLNVFEPLNLELPLRAVPWAVRATSSGHTFKPDKLKSFQDDLELLVRSKVKPGYFVGPVALDLLVVFKRGKGRQKDAKGRLTRYDYHDVKPDRDNLLKAVQDGLKLFWSDDAVVVDGVTTKLWGDEDKLILRIYPAQPIEELLDWWQL